MPKVDKEGVGALGSMVLLTLSELEPCSIQTICDHIGRDNSQMTRVLKALRTKGMLEQESDPSDKRVCLVRLSEKGQAHIALIRQTMSEVIDDLIKPLSTKDRDSFLRLLTKILTTAE